MFKRHPHFIGLPLVYGVKCISNFYEHLQEYEGDSICNEIVPINQKVLYLYTLQLNFQTGLLLGYTTAKSQLSSSFTTLHNPLSSKGTKLQCDTNLSSGFKFRILYDLSLFIFCLFVW